VRPDVNEQGTFGLNERKHDSAIVVDAEAPQPFQLSGKAMSSQSRIEWIVLKDNCPISKTRFEYSVTTNFSLECFSESGR
jgi:hypothetical protein